MERFFDAFEKLGTMPEMGHRREDLTPRLVRFWTIDRYMMIYKPEPLPIEIGRVLSGWRDLPTLLQ
jgi:plasmid stabilization system protein ParE